MPRDDTNADAPERFPFDQIYKTMCRHPATVRDMLRNFLARPRGPLAVEMVDALDLRTVRRLPAEWVTRDFRTRRGDIVLYVRFKRAARQRGYPPGLLLHLEHQSGPDPFMALRFLDYGGELYRELREARVLEKDAECPILCVLIHNGNAPWTAPTQAADLVRLPVALGRAPAVPPDVAAFYPWGYHVLDLVRLQQQAPVPGSVVSMMASIEYAGREGFAEAFTDGPLVETWRRLDASLRRTVAMWIWRLAQRHGIEAELEDLMRFEEIGKVTSRLEERIDRELAEGRAQAMREGLAEGRVRGRAEGRVEGRAEGRMEGRAEAMAEERTLISSIAARRFGERAAARLSALLAGLSTRESLRQAGVSIVESESGEDLLRRVDQIAAGSGNGRPT